MEVPGKGRGKIVNYSVEHMRYKVELDKKDRRKKDEEVLVPPHELKEVCVDRCFFISGKSSLKGIATCNSSTEKGKTPKNRDF